MSGRKKAKRRVVGWTPPNHQEGRFPQGDVQLGKPARRPRRQLVLLVAAALAVPVMAVSAFLILAVLNAPSGPPRALIVDQLALTVPNPEFVKEAGTLLEDAGYRVRYVPYENVTVDFYRQLGAGGFHLIILRTHVARLWDRETNDLGDDAVFFTSEPYTNTRYVKDQRESLVVPAAYSRDSEAYFGVMPAFFEYAANGDYDGATVILMGCDSLRSDRMARAILDKGAKAVVGWTGPVSAEHTDAATERLLQHLVVEGLPTAEAVAKTVAELGRDPEFGSMLLVYPSGG